ncbi:MAG: DUF4922 domain-containing protein [Bacteroidales bacterium]|nr:DUF4922 domain-containing protein [Bacteroidales bacterium]
MREQDILDKFVRDQLSVWPLAAANFRALKDAQTRELTVGGLTVRVQHNPARIRSSAARVDKASIQARSCFLCADARPAEQRALKFEGRKGRKYDILVNPYPIFPGHLTIARDRHVDQSIWKCLPDMADLAHHYTGLTVFYNGPRCGASAPDHMHFQACPRGLLPLENVIDRQLDTRGDDLTFLTSVKEAQLFHYKKFTRGVFVLRARTSKSLAKLFYRLLDCVPTPEGETEPMFNLLMWYKSLSGGRRPAGNTHGLAAFEYRAIVLLRGAHRSHHYFDEGPDHLTMSPGSADMAGLFIAPQAEDYAKLDSRLLTEMLSEVSVDEQTQRDVLWRLTRSQQTLQVGILSGKEIVFEIISDGAGPQKVSYQEGKISYNGVLYDELFFEASTPSTLFAEPTFILHDVVIGVDFHWERRQSQQFAGSLKFIVEKNQVVAVNVIGVEDYLLSVISSEMKATAGLEFLKAHAVISRSWVLAQIARRARPAVPAGVDLSLLNNVPALVTSLEQTRPETEAKETEETVIERWFDHSDHKHFDVCADDHCQRYQGLTLAIGKTVRQAIDQTWGEVLTYGGELCDARFSKCCGGMSERFSTCWEDRDEPYLAALPDTPDHGDGDPFCDTHDETVLQQVLNDYDLETKDFYRWTEEYGVEELSALIARRSGFDIGRLTALEPLETGPSGRICKLRIVGTKKTLTVGKELMIRKFLSESHLKSSAFTATFTPDGKVRLDGRGWGHGVGLCQIGAAVMGSRGYTYRQILSHYYPGAQLTRYEQK